MIETFTFVRTEVPGGAIYLTRPAREALGRGCPGMTVLTHGARRLEATVVPIPDEGRELPISPAVADALMLMESIPYRLRWADGALLIGPVIGINVADHTQKPEWLEPGELRYGFLLRYPDVGGLVYLFGTDDMDLTSRTIEGYCWLPGEPDGSPAEPDVWVRCRTYGTRVQRTAAEEENPLPPHPRTARFKSRADQFLAETPPPEQRGGWSGVAGLGCGRFVPGRFPFPAAMWRRSITLGPSIRTRLMEQMGVRLFNSHFFNKDEAWRLLSVDPAVRPHLPATEPLRSAEQLVDWLDRHGRALLKPADSTSGFGLLGLRREDDGYSLRNRQSGHVETIASVDALAERLAREIGDGGYLLQQWVELPVYRDRPNDYRVIMQKDDRGRWRVAGMLGRFGQPGAILTNFIQHGYALPGHEALLRVFGVSHREAHALETCISEVAMAVCEALDRSGGLYGDLGMDIAIDRDRRVWLFEVNKRYDMELPLHAGLEQMYLDVKSGPLLYAARLAGFGK